MASYTLSLQCKRGVKVIFDRVCSVAIMLKLRDVYSSNLDEEFYLRCTKVASEKHGLRSDIDSDENVSALAALGLRYIVFTLEDTAASADDEPDVEAVVPQRSVHDVLIQKKKKKSACPPLFNILVWRTTKQLFLGALG